jgi:glycosyltransferase involved in cell wall biosynthesis
LFVGRLAPNKAQHELVKMFALYRRAFDPDARLWLVGPHTVARYHVAVDRFVTAAGLTGAVHLTGAVSDGALNAYYDVADAFVSMSRHEGFGVPLLEAMAHDTPVIARASAAVPETVADAGVLLDGDAPIADYAAAAWRVATDAGLRAALVERGRRRLDAYALPRLREQLLDALGPVLAVRV